MKTSFFKILRNETILFIPIIYYFIKKYRNLNINSSILKKLSTDEIQIILFTLAGLIVPTVMLASPEFPLRSCFISPIFILIASLIAMKYIKLPKLNYSIIYIVISIWLVSIMGAIYSDFSIRLQTKQRFEMIAEQRDKDLIVVPLLHSSRILERVLGMRIYGSDLIRLGGDLELNDPKWAHNVMFAKYYNLKQIITVDTEQR